MKASLNSLHHQITDWLRETDFYKQEVSIFEERLREVASKNTSQEVLAQVEHFQNKFILTKEQLDILAHDLNKEESVVEEKVKKSPEHTHEKFVTPLDKTQARVKTFASGFADLRFEFNTFLSKTL
jgi:predicted  nucleic acid-binding Zn-ribbon protein